MSLWGLVRVSVADVRKEPDQRSEQVTQAIMGMALEVLDQHENWRLTRLPDGYMGWVNQLLLQIGEEKLVRQWKVSPKVMVTSPMALILSRPNRAAIPVSDAVIGTELLLVKERGRWILVALPDGRQGWIARRDTLDVGDLIHLEGGSQDEIITTARGFTGFPYLWGGTTPKGFDCSGFVQTVFRLNGLLLPRDAQQQFAWGEDVPGQQKLRPADLLFFRPQAAQRITHVAIHIREGQFIHCSGYVKTNSLDPSAEDYDASLKAKFIGAKRAGGGLMAEC